ncbi:MAG TPA: TAXI family TRAP transporter solute-binding subunit [candidate division Zixibacteria bacterium]|nr:TAXI family TRAP transporter solute-binding subunit [candidate division Zixibacteria bacterium]
MEPLPKGANFQRALMLWEIGLHIAGNPLTPYYGPRDMCICVGSGSHESFKPWLRMSTGSPILAHAVCRGELEAAMINPSGLLTQAYRGTGLFPEPLPVRILAVYPSLDHFVFAIHPRTGLRSLAEIKEKRYPLRLSIREDATHSTRVLLDQTLAAYDMTLQDIESWGGSLQLNGGPGDARRMKALGEGTIDAIFDEGLVLWLDEALACGMQPVTLDDFAFRRLLDLGWRKYTIRPGRYKNLTQEHTCIDYSGWPLYTRAALPDDDAYKICDAIMARKDQIYWESSYAGIDQLGRDTDATPRDVPLHPGAERWYREHGVAV